MNAVLSITDLAERYVESDEASLPVYPRTAQLVQDKARQPNSSAPEIARVINVDPVLSAQVLRHANSSFYGGLKSVDSVADAIVRLGLNEVVNIALLCAQRDVYASRDRAAQATMRKLWQHAVATAFAARWLALRAGFRELAPDAFMAGLFHDVGRLAVIRALEAATASGHLSQELPGGLQAELVERLHTRVGARVISRWNLADKFARVAAEHHDADIGEAEDLLVLVRLADMAAAKLGFDLVATPEVPLSATDEAARLRLDDIALAELQVRLEDGMKALGA